MFRYTSRIPAQTDPYNHSNGRNRDNTPQNEYNCAGYALNTFSWYCPHDDESEWFNWSANWDMEYMRMLTEKAVAYMLADFPDMRVIKRMRELQKDEYAIAFRVSSDGDFHFCKRDEHRHWTHKPGASYIRKIFAYEVHNMYWHRSRYDGPIVYFAKKKG